MVKQEQNNTSREDKYRNGSKGEGTLFIVFASFLIRRPTIFAVTLRSTVIYNIRAIRRFDKVIVNQNACTTLNGKCNFAIRVPSRHLLHRSVGIC